MIPTFEADEFRRYPDLFNRRHIEADGYLLPVREEVSSPVNSACRICYEHDIVGNSLIHPCKCTGSVRYIHEECLKAWLVARDSSIDKGECELCHTKFKMKFIIEARCSLQKGCRDRVMMWVFIPLMLLVAAMLSGIIYVLAAFYLAEAKSDEETGYAVVLIFICVFAAVVLISLIIYASKQSCLLSSLKDWQILSIEDIDEIERMDQSKDNSVSGVPLMPPSYRDGRVLVMPRRITVKNVEVDTPELMPNLASLLAEGNKTVFVPPRIAQSLNITPNRSRVASVAPMLKSSASTPTISSFKIVPTMPHDASTKRCEED